MPAPSPTQNVPKPQSRTPTANFRIFSGIIETGRRSAAPSITTTPKAAKAPSAAGSSNCDDDEDDLDPFDHRDLERGGGRWTIPASPRTRRAEGPPLRGIKRVLVMQGDDAGTPQDRFPQPPHTEQHQQGAERELHGFQRDARQQRTQPDDKQKQHPHSEAAASKGASPAPHSADRQHDRQRFDEFHQRGQESRQNRRPSVKNLKRQGASPGGTAFSLLP
jgi:hypothetical protein